MELRPFELELLALVVVVGLLFALPVVGIPRALCRAATARKSVRGVVLSSVGGSVAVLGLLGGTNWVLCLVLLSLNGLWLGASLWANSRASNAPEESAS